MIASQVASQCFFFSQIVPLFGFLKDRHSPSETSPAGAMALGLKGGSPSSVSSAMGIESYLTLTEISESLVMRP